MKLFTAFLRLVRWQNLAFIVITQLLFYYSLVQPLYDKGFAFNFDRLHFLLLIIASVLIAAAGYIINDYFDLNIDQVNKPERTVIDKTIKRRWAIVQHIVFSVAGVLISIYIDLTTRTFWLGISNFICVMLLFGYSISLKKKLLIGNILISALTAWVILVAFLCYYRTLYCTECDMAYYGVHIHSFIRISVLYAGFAFIISLIREVVKDLEDIEGDARYGCKTMPIVWGIPASKLFVAVLLILLISIICVVQAYVLQFGWWWSAAYSIVLIIVPLIWIIFKLKAAQSPADYHRLSTAIKLVMFAGILSMLVFRIYS
jgi:4-hydroxybenzoate polyprenyltransferase